jgi:uncharacterized protein (UPF0305 family)
MTILSRLRSIFNIKKEETKAIPIPIQTVSPEEHNKVKQALEESNSKVQSLIWLKKLLIEQKEDIKKEFDTLKAQYRKDIISALAKSAYSKTDEDRNHSIESMTNARLTLEEINDLYEPLRSLKHKTIQAAETKLVQTSGVY